MRYIVPASEQGALSLCRHPRTTDTTWRNVTDPRTGASQLIPSGYDSSLAARDCPFKREDGRFDLGLYCAPFGNPGGEPGDPTMGFWSFDNILLAWLLVFTHVRTCLPHTLRACWAAGPSKLLLAALTATASCCPLLDADDHDHMVENNVHDNGQHKLVVLDLALHHGTCVRSVWGGAPAMLSSRTASALYCSSLLALQSRPCLHLMRLLLPPQVFLGGMILVNLALAVIFVNFEDSKREPWCHANQRAHGPLRIAHQRAHCVLAVGTHEDVAKEASTSDTSAAEPSDAKGAQPVAEGAEANVQHSRASPWADPLNPDPLAKPLPAFPDLSDEYEEPDTASQQVKGSQSRAMSSTCSVFALMYRLLPPLSLALSLAHLAPCCLAAGRGGCSWHAAGGQPFWQWQMGWV